MPTECSSPSLTFQAAHGRAVVARFDGGTLTSDGGALLLREVEQRTGILRQFAACFRDHRNPARIEHPVAALVAQRVYALALGYEDLADHDALRADPLLAVLVGVADPTGGERARGRDAGKALAGKSTLNRLELTGECVGERERYKKIVMNPGAIDRMLVDVFLQAYEVPPEEIVLDVLDLDATDDPLHGHQEGRFFHGYYGCYCYLPLYVFSGEHLLVARLRPANIDAAAGAVDELARIIPQIRAAWPTVKLTLRADSGFCREEVLAWCEAHGVDYVVGVAKNPRLSAMITEELARAAADCAASGQPARAFAELTYRTLETWGRSRRVVAKAEYLPAAAAGEAPKANPRFVVTSLTVAARNARALYEELYCEELYCARGEMENRIKEQQLQLFADRTSSSMLRANQLRLYFASVAYLLMHALRRLGLAGTALARAQCQTIRLTLLKIGARVRITARKVWVALASGCPSAELFAQVHAKLLRC